MNVAVFGAGVFRAGAVAGNRPFTYEPYLLAGLLKEKAVIHVYDCLPEVVEALQSFDGTLHVFATWKLSEMIGRLAGLDENVLSLKYGPQWRNALRMKRVFFEDFLRQNRGDIVDEGWALVDGAEYPFVTAKFAPDAFPGVRVPKGPVDMATSELGDDPLDLAHFLLSNPYLDEGSRDSVWGLATLFRIVDRLKPGGYLISDPNSKIHPECGIQIESPHAPDPCLMKLMGLEAVADFRSEEEPVIIFRKKEKSNPFVRKISGNIDHVLADARGSLLAEAALSDETDEPVVPESSPATAAFPHRFATVSPARSPKTGPSLSRVRGVKG